MRQRTRFHAAIGRLAGAAVVVAALVSGSTVVGVVTGSTVPIAGASSSASGGCAAKPVTGPKVLKLKILDTSAGKVPTVSVCIDGKGPYRFLVSTGTGSSVVTPALARKLHLNKSGDDTAVRGVTCVASAPSAKVRKWSMSGAKLDAQRLLVAKIAVPGASRAPKGIIGSDVLERFGAVRIDYVKSRLTLLGSEGAAPTGDVYVLGQRTSKLPAALDGGPPKAGQLLRVFESAHGTIVAVPMKIAGRTEQLAVDSGSAGSALVPAIARALKLKAGGTNLAVSGVGCRGTASTYLSGSWTLGGSRLVSTSFAARPISGTLNSGLQGVLGANVLAADGSVIVDYEGAHLWLTSG